MESKTSDIVIKLFESSLSARERKIVRSDLFGERYPDEDLTAEMCLSIIAKLRPSARVKLKPLKLIQHLSKHFRIREEDQIDIVDTTLSEGERAMRLLNCINIKSSFPIVALYIALLDSSSEQDGPPTHHQLACEMKRISQEVVSEVTPSLTDKIQSFTGDSTLHVLDESIKKLMQVTITSSQANELIKRLGIEIPAAASNSSIDLAEILNIWKDKKGMWVTLYDIVENMILTRGIGIYVVLLKARPYSQLKNFLEGLNQNWVDIARYIGFGETEIETFVSVDESVSKQLDLFLCSWTLPDCGERTGVILHRLRRLATTPVVTEQTNGTVSSIHPVPVSSIPLVPVSIIPPVPVSSIHPVPVSSIPPVPVSSIPHVPVSIIPPVPVSSILPVPVSIIPSVPVSSIPHVDTDSPNSDNIGTMDSPVDTHNYSIVATTPVDVLTTTVDRSLPISSAPIVSQSPTSSLQLTKTSRRHSLRVIRPNTSSYIATGGRGDEEVLADRSKNSDTSSLTDLSYEISSHDDLVLSTVTSERREGEGEGGREGGPISSSGDQTVWPTPIQQSHKTITLPYTHATAHVHFTAPVSTTIPTWSGGWYSLPKSSCSSNIVPLRSSPEDSPVEDNEEATTSNSLPTPYFPTTAGSDPAIKSITSDQSVNSKELLLQEEHEEKERGNREGEVEVEMKEEEKEEKEGEEREAKEHKEGEGEVEVKEKEREKIEVEEVKEKVEEENKEEEDDLSESEEVSVKPNWSTLSIVNPSDIYQSMCQGSVDEFKTYCQGLDNPVEDVNRPVPVDCSDDGNYLLHIAVRQSKREHVKVLIDFGAHVDQIDDKRNGVSPLHIASEIGDSEIIELLLGSGATVDIKDKNGSTPLLLVNLHKSECIDLLLQAHADVGAINNEHITPLVVAVVAGSYSVVKVLLENNASHRVVNHIRKCKGQSGEYNWITPLADAAARGHLDIVKLLVDCGANLNSTGEEGKPPDQTGEGGGEGEGGSHISPLLLPCLNNHVEVVRFLTNHPRFISQIDYIVDPITEALRNDHIECAQLIWERYNGGIQSLLADCGTKFPELKELLQVQATSTAELSHSNSTISGNNFNVGTTSTTDDVMNDFSALEEGDNVDINTITVDDSGMNDLSDIECGGPPPAASVNTLNDFSDSEFRKTVKQLPTSTSQIFNQLSDKPSQLNTFSLPPRSLPPPKLNSLSDTPRSLPQLTLSDTPQSLPPPQLNTLSDTPRSLPPPQLNTLSDTPRSLPPPQLNTLSDTPRSLPRLDTLSDTPQSLPRLNSLSDTPRSLPRLDTLSDTPQSLPQLNSLSDTPRSLPQPNSLSDTPRSLPRLDTLSDTPRSLPQLNTLSDTPRSLPQLNTLSNTPLQPNSFSDSSRSLPPPPPSSVSSPLTKDTLSYSHSLSIPSTTTAPSQPIQLTSTNFSEPISSGATPFGGGRGAVYDIHDSATDTDNPFEPRPKTPPVSSSPPPTAHTVEVSGNLRNFQTSAVEVLHDFAQFMIQACLQKRSPEDIISKAQDIDEISLVHFFTRYFYDAASATRGGEFVAEFIKGFPSPLNFLISARLCNKNDFLNVLREFGREDFTDQLMLALHQFQDSDTIPWNGTDVLNALFYQHFTVGTPFPITAMQERTREIEQKRSLQQRLTDESTAPVDASFPGQGIKLGGSATDSSFNTATGGIGEENYNTQNGKKVNVSIFPNKDESSKSKLYQDDTMVTTQDQPIEDENEPMTCDSSTSLREEGNNLDSPVTPLRDHSIKRPVTEGSSTSADEGDLTTNVDTSGTTGPKLLPSSVDTSGTTAVKLLPSSVDTSGATGVSTVNKPLPSSSSSNVKLVQNSERLIQLIKSSTDSEEDDIIGDERGATSLVLTESEPVIPKLPSLSSLTSKEKVTKQVQTKPLTRPLSKVDSVSSPRVTKKVPSRSVSSTSQSTQMKGSKTSTLSPYGSSTQTVSSTDKKRLSTTRGTLEQSKSGLRPQQATTSKILSPSMAAGRNSLYTPYTASSSSSTRSKIPPVRGRPTVEQPKQTVGTKTTSKKLEPIQKKPATTLKKLSSSPKLKSAVPRTKQQLDISRQYDVVQTSIIPSPEVKRKWLNSYPLPDTDSLNLPSTRIEASISLFEVLAKSLTNWKMLGRYLELDDDSLSMISKLGSDSNDQAIQMLKLWFGQSRTPITYQRLGEALVNCMKNELIVVLQGHYQNPTDKPICELVPVTRSAEHPSIAGNDDYDIIVTVPVSKVLSTIKPFIDDQENEGKKTKVTVSLKFH